jgi:hypothetical protein
MADRFLTYLRNEQARLEQAIAEVARRCGDEMEIASLRRQRRIVDDQLARWTEDLRDDAMAA